MSTIRNLVIFVAISVLSFGCGDRDMDSAASIDVKSDTHAIV